MMRGTTDTTKENAPVQRGNFSATTTKHGNDHSANHAENKAVSSWQTRFAMLGHTLYQVTPANGTTAFLVTRWGMTRELADLTEVAKFFHLIGGKL